MSYGRQAEQARIDELLGGLAGALVVRGEAGIGKSTLLEYAAARASGWCEQPGGHCRRLR
ncbi:AAA family ATPase [Streptosporangium sp. NPDC000396]|uniref:AAA family ATPase n=1 Tax=Streptosporangium sp. NPDC000396 TaxID=3366185 RepID=UPI00367B1FE3